MFAYTIVGMATHPGLCPIAQETTSAAPMLCTEYGPNGWMDDHNILSIHLAEGEDFDNGNKTSYLV